MDGTEGATAPEVKAAAPKPKAKKAKKPATKKTNKKPAKKAKKKTVVLKSRRSGKDLRKHPLVRKAKKSAKVSARPVERPERVDMRLTKQEKARIVAKAKRLKRTVTSILMEAVAKVAK